MPLARRYAECRAVQRVQECDNWSFINRFECVLAYGSRPDSLPRRLLRPRIIVSAAKLSVCLIEKRRPHSSFCLLSFLPYLVLKKMAPTLINP